MAKTATPTKPTNKPSAKAGGKEKAETKAKVEAVANANLVAAFRELKEAADGYQSALINAATICQEEQCTRAEIVASYMEARDCTKATAESQVSRMRKLLTDEETFQDLKDGKITLKTARAATTKKQTAPNADKQREALEQRYTRCLTGLVAAAKEGGYDLGAVLAGVKAACKKEGIR